MNQTVKPELKSPEMKEEWRDVKGYEGRYMVSSIGNVKSIIYPNPRILKQHGHGVEDLDEAYRGVRLYKNKKSIRGVVHRLVCEAFIPNPDNKPQINHKNGIKYDNSVENLEWCTASENQKHRFSDLGCIIHNRELTKEQVFEILSQIGKGWRKNIAAKFGVSEGCIKAVRTGENYNEWFKEYKNNIT